MTEQTQDPVQTSQQEVVELSFPASVDLVVLARFTAATVAARAGFDIDEIEDLRLAVDELCVSFGPLEWYSNVRLQFERDEDLVRITGEFDPRSKKSIENSPEFTDLVGAKRAESLSRQLLDALVDGNGRELNDGRRVAWLEKRRGSDKL
jgi:serine/threonine-protein kinase RsbW